LTVVYFTRAIVEVLDNSLDVLKQMLAVQRKEVLADLQEGMERLVAKWRREGWDAVDECADELEALLAEQRKEER
jgi:hypothetical protein